MYPVGQHLPALEINDIIVQSSSIGMILFFLWLRSKERPQAQLLHGKTTTGMRTRPFKKTLSRPFCIWKHTVTKTNFCVGVPF
jgi:hypothetical protein